MPHHGDEYRKNDVLSILRENGSDPSLVDWFDKCIDFHTYPAPGILIGVYMVDYALSLLNAKPTDRLYAVSESIKCLPDALQVITHCTIGNHRLRIVPIGRFAISMNPFSTEIAAEGVRISMNPATLTDTPALEAWFANTPSFDGKTMKKQVVDEILKKGRGMLSWEKVRIPIVLKEKWKTEICSLCGEPVPSYMIEENGICSGCGSMKYYEKFS
jgi:formylmethanofuran dehydrogenase subunit E